MVMVLLVCITRSWHTPAGAAAGTVLFGPKTLAEVAAEAGPYTRALLLRRGAAQTPSAVAEARRVETVRTLGFRPPAENRRHTRD